MNKFRLKKHGFLHDVHSVTVSLDTVAIFLRNEPNGLFLYERFFPEITKLNQTG